MVVKDFSLYRTMVIKDLHIYRTMAVKDFSLYRTMVVMDFSLYRTMVVKDFKHTVTDDTITLSCRTAIVKFVKLTLSLTFINEEFESITHCS